MNEAELELALESAATAHRARDPHGRLTPPPAWFDLPPEALDQLFLRQAWAREVERALHPEGLSGTVQAVLDALGGAGA